MSDSLNGRKLRPLIPKPSSNASSKETTESAISNPYCSCIYRANLFALNLQLASASDQSKIDMNTQPLVMSSRWNPTPEQLHALDEMYRCGIRTPTPEQIQQIAAKLRRFGKIEGKNVFYWFQNHKARERQKRRRLIESGSEEQLIYGLESLQGKESAELTSRKGQTKNWATPSNCTTLSEECVSLHRAVAAAETRANGWTLFEERELEQSQSSTDTVAKHATWQMKDPELSCTPPSYLLNTTIATTTTTTTTTTNVPEALGAIDPKLFNTQQLGIVLTHNNNSGVTQFEDESRESQTVLQLFPLRSDICNHQVPITTINANTTPNQYYEFLPLKN